MSAFLCENSVFAAIANFARFKGLLQNDSPELAVKAANTLKAANIKSLRARYSAHITDGLDKSKVDEHDFGVQAFKDAIPIVKLCDCFDYQACEYEGYKRSIAAKLVANVRERALRDAAKEKAKHEFAVAQHLAETTDVKKLYEAMVESAEYGSDPWDDYIARM